MAGRHGNKGVVSRVLPVEDMPFLPNGRPLDIVLNPLGVPSRMNIGQVLEIHLSLAAKALGFNISTPVFDGANEVDIEDTLELANDYVNLPFDKEELEKDLQAEHPYWSADAEIFYDKYVDTLREDVMEYLSTNRAHRSLWKGVPISKDGKVQLRDGRTGECFDGKTTIGHMHYLKLHHLVDDKIHARSTGPYSLVTQQPLGGKAQFGGQRFGEMEVWALVAVSRPKRLSSRVRISLSLVFQSHSRYFSKSFRHLVWMSRYLMRTEKRLSLSRQVSTVIQISTQLSETIRTMHSRTVSHSQSMVSQRKNLMTTKSLLT